MAPSLTLGQAIRARRKDCDLTQQRLAALVGCAVVTLKKIEADKLRPSRQMAERIAEALRIPFAERDAFVRTARAPLHTSLEEVPSAAYADNPYRGLAAFQERDTRLFFGRDHLIRRLLERLGQTRKFARFLAVVGPSGSGKSSLVKAGLLPLLRHGGLPHSEHWLITEMVPGLRPLEELEAALLRVAVNPPTSLIEQLAADQRGLSRAAKRILPADPNVELVILIDQFEELFTLVDAEADRLHLLQSILEAVQDPRSRLRILITLRADCFALPLGYLGFAELIQQRTEVVTPLSAAELVEAITRPAELAGTRVETNLVGALIHDVQSQPGALPLLQYTLTELYQARDRGPLTLAAYRALGGITSSLGQRAEELFASLDVNEQQVARQIFLRLVQPGEQNTDLRRRVQVSELSTQRPSFREHALGGNDPERDRSPETRAVSFASVLRRYGDARLLTFDHNVKSGEATVEVAHEALFRAWPRLCQWIDDSREILHTHRRLVAAMHEWWSNGREPSFLAAGTRLAQFEELLATITLMPLTPDEQTYLYASIDERTRQRDTEQAIQAQLHDNLARSEAQRLAAEANKLLQFEGNAELIALLALYSLSRRYTPQGDEALAGAALLDYPTQQFVGHTGRIYSVDYAPDGCTILTAGQDNTVRWWDVKTGACLRVLAGHTNVVYTAEFISNGRRAVSACKDGAVRTWDLQTGDVLMLYQGTHGAINDLACSPDGQRVLVAHPDSTARVIDLYTAVELGALNHATGRMVCVAWSPDGALLACADDKLAVSVWDAASGRRLHLLEQPDGLLDRLRFSPDGQHLAGSTTEGSVQIWDLSSGAIAKTLRGHSDGVNTVAYDSRGAVLLSGGSDSTARLWDAESGTEIRRFVAHSNFVFGARFSPDDQYVLLGSADHTARLWHREARPYLPIVRGESGRLAGVAFAPDGNTFFTGGRDLIIRQWQMESGQLLRAFHGHRVGLMTGGLACSPNGLLVASSSEDSTVRIWEIASARELHCLVGHRSWVWGVAFAPDSKTLVTAGNDRTVRLWDVETGNELRQFIGHTNQPIGVGFSPDGRRVVSGSDDSTARIWDVASGAEVQRFTDPNGPILGVAFASDDRCIVAGSSNGMVREWDVASGKVAQEYVGHSGHVWAVAYTPDGQYILSGSIDTTARLWERSSGHEVRRFAGHKQAVVSVACSPNGRYVLTGSSDGTARVWDLDYRETMRYLRARLLRHFSEHETRQYGIEQTVG